VSLGRNNLSPSPLAPTVQAQLWYLDQCAGRPVSHSEGERQTNFSVAPHMVAIADARRSLEPPSLQREGFELICHASAISSLPSIEEIEQCYLPESEQLLRQISGTPYVHVFASGLRFNERSEHTGSRPNSRPARRVHSDFSDAGAREVVGRAFGTGGEVPAGGYYTAYNLWRVLSAPPQDTPLALCEMRSVRAEDRITAEGVLAVAGKPEFRYEFCLYRYDPGQRWWYFQDMHRDEVLIFMGYDSRDTERRVPHCAFDDPSCPPGAVPRISIEVRGVAYFPA
jgi:hypothetical protein